MHNMKNQAEILNQAVSVLKKAGLVLVPSDTVYGLAVDATSEKAVKKLINFKSRSLGKAISIFVENLEMAKKYVQISKKNLNILKKILPGCFTAVLPSRHKLAGNLESEKGTLGIRIPEFDFINDLVKKYGKPLTATSANLSGRSPHYSVTSFIDSLSDKKKKQIDMIVDFGKLPRNKPSTVVDLTLSKFKILRSGSGHLVSKKKYISSSPMVTKKIAKSIISDLLKDEITKPAIVLLEGELGVGKTIFVKGVGEYFGVNNIVSPTFVLICEYEFKNKKIKKLYHLDLYRIEEEEEFKNLGLREILKSKNLICIEWGQKSGAILKLFEKKARIIYVNIEYINEKQRKLTVSNNS